VLCGVQDEHESQTRTVWGAVVGWAPGKDVCCYVLAAESRPMPKACFNTS
jgi:hypothetical protein